tara:strand:+ start:538 stop:858 length:321 start_codon:yes stop_codon:yes gene_type:complete
MKKVGSIQFFEDVDLHLKFDFDELIDYFKGNELGIKQNLLDENENIKMDKLDLFVQKYINDKIKEKYGDDFSLDTMDDIMNISWDINVESIKKKHIEGWWNKESSE